MWDRQLEGRTGQTDVDRVKKTVTQLRACRQVEDRELNAATAPTCRFEKLRAETFKFSLVPATSHESKTLNSLVVEDAPRARGFSKRPRACAGCRGVRVVKVIGGPAPRIRRNVASPNGGGVFMTRGLSDRRCRSPRPSVTIPSRSFRVSSPGGSMSKLIRTLAAAVAVGALVPGIAPGAVYPSNVVINGTTVTFVLNEGGATLTYSINGGSPQTLDGSTAGTKTFNLTSPTDAFSISASKSDSVGYTIPTGTQTAASASGLSVTTNNGGYRLVSADTNVLGRYNSPRGVAVNNDPNSGPLFGTAYISNSAAGTVAASGSLPARTLGDGIYAVKADGTDAFGYGDTAQNPGNVFDGAGASANSPFRVSVARGGDVYVADFSDANGNVYKLNPTLTTGAAVLAGIGGPTTLPAGQNHGSVTGTHAIPGAGGALTLYTVDEDLTPAQFGGADATDKNHLWRYDIPAPGTLPYSGTPTKVNQANVLLTGCDERPARRPGRREVLPRPVPLRRQRGRRRRPQPGRDDRVRLAHRQPRPARQPDRPRHPAERAGDRGLRGPAVSGGNDQQQRRRGRAAGQRHPRPRQPPADRHRHRRQQRPRHRLRRGGQHPLRQQRPGRLPRPRPRRRHHDDAELRRLHVHVHRHAGPGAGRRAGDRPRRVRGTVPVAREASVGRAAVVTGDRKSGRTTAGAARLVL